ncbi:MAG: tRNA lysidine(34) synthetase TilS [Mycoplasmatota bacterium]
MKEIQEKLNNKLKNGDTVVLALSGGPDSMCILDLLLKTNKKIKIICAHVNHNSGREGQIKDQEFVVDFCKKNSLTLEIKIIEEYTKDNFHSQAHKIRYEFFESLIKKYKASYLITAHHGDDLIESILMRLVRGSTLKGYAGFDETKTEEDYTIFRPLIDVNKKEILDYLESNIIPFRIDDSNASNKYTRNRYRNNILPFLKSENPNVHEKFHEFSINLKETNNYLDKIVSKEYKNIYNEYLDINKYVEIDNFIGKKVILKILEEEYKEQLHLINNIHVLLINQLINTKDSNKEIDLPNNIKAVKTYDKVYFKKQVKEQGYHLELEEKMVLINDRIIEVIKESDSDSNFICRINYEDIKLPLYIRTKQIKDKIKVKGLNGTKKVKDIFIDSKISIDDRKSYPILVDSNEEVIWIPGLKKSNLCKSMNEKYDIIIRYY